MPKCSSSSNMPITKACPMWPCSGDRSSLKECSTSRTWQRGSNFPINWKTAKPCCNTSKPVLDLCDHIFVIGGTVGHKERRFCQAPAFLGQPWQGNQLQSLHFALLAP